NVLSLLLGGGRLVYHEMALRHALGATRSRLVSLLLSETLLVMIVASVIAVIAVQQVLPLLLSEVPGAVSQRASRIVVGPMSILFAMSLTAIAALIAGLWPAVTVSRPRSDAMRSASAARAGAGAGRIGSGILIAAQVTIAVVLLAGTGASIRAPVHLYREPAGYDPSRVTIAQIYLPIGSYTTWPERVAVYERVRAEVGREASVQGASIRLIPTGPPPRTGVSTRIEADGLRATDREVLAHSVASDYFSTLNMPLARGHMWTASDDARAEAVTVINETMARQLWPNQDPIGKRVR